MAVRRCHTELQRLYKDGSVDYIYYKNTLKDVYLSAKDGSPTIQNKVHYFGTCSSEPASNKKVIEGSGLTNENIVPGIHLTVQFLKGNTCTDTGITLDPRGCVSVPVICNGDNKNFGFSATTVIEFVYDGYSWFAVNVPHKTGSGFNHIPAGGSNNQYLGFSGENGKASWIDLPVYLPATTTSDGLMSKEDKQIISKLPDPYKIAKTEYVDKKVKDVETSVLKNTTDIAALNKKHADHDEKNTDNSDKITDIKTMVDALSEKSDEHDDYILQDKKIKPYVKMLDFPNLKDLVNINNEYYESFGDENSYVVFVFPMGVKKMHLCIEHAYSDVSTGVLDLKIIQCYPSTTTIEPDKWTGYTVIEPAGKFTKDVTLSLQSSSCGHVAITGKYYRISDIYGEV